MKPWSIWLKAPTRVSWPVTRFAAGGIDWASGGTMRQARFLLLADCGGSNGYRVPLFRQQLHQLSQLLRRTFRVCHLPPYCSKYNPIDHRLFCHLSRSLQAIQLTSIDAIHQALQQTTTRTGLRVICELARRKYEAGIKADPEFLANEPTRRDDNLSAYNYKFSPN